MGFRVRRLERRRSRLAKVRCGRFDLVQRVRGILPRSVEFQWRCGRNLDASEVDFDLEGSRTKTHSVKLKGEAARGARISVTAMNEITEVLIEAAKGALRLRVEGRSTARGSVPSWLAEAAHFDIVGITEGSTVLGLEAPELAEAAPAKFQQGSLFHPIDPGQTALDLVQESLSEAIAGRTDSEVIDPGLLRTFSKFHRTLALGYSSIQMNGGKKKVPLLRAR